MVKQVSTDAMEKQSARRKARFYWPREHGGWSMLSSACIIGAAAGHWNNGALAAIAVALALFMVREPLYVSLNRRNAWLQVIATLTAMVLPGVYLLLTQDFMWVVIAALFAGVSTYEHMRLRLQRQERSVAVEVLGIAQLSSAALFVYVFGGGSDLKRALLLMALVFAYYAGSIFYVKMRVTQAKQNPTSVAELFALGRANVIYQTVMLVLMTGLTAGHLLPGWLALGFAPNIAKSLLHVFFPLRNLSLKRVGVMEMLYAGIFTAVLAAWA